MHTLFCYYCLFCPISILLHTINSTLYFVLFRTEDDRGTVEICFSILKVSFSFLYSLNICFYPDLLAKLDGSQIHARANSAMSRIGAVVNKMMQINGEMIIVNYFVVLLDVLQTKKGTLGRDSSVSNPILFLKHNWNPKGNRSFLLLMYLSENCTNIGL